MYIDTHCHLHDEKLKDTDLVIEEYSNVKNYSKHAKEALIEMRRQVKDTFDENGIMNKSILDIVRRLPISVVIITKPNNLLTKQDIIKYNKQYDNLSVRYDNSFHDRYFILDDQTVYHCGASINRIGYKTFSINLIEDEEIRKALTKKLSNLRSQIVTSKQLEVSN